MIGGSASEPGKPDVRPQADDAAAEIKLRAERRAGEFLGEMDMNKGIRLDGKNEDGKFRPSHDGSTEPPTLSELGITHNQSSRLQKIASLPEETFERLCMCNIA